MVRNLATTSLFRGRIFQTAVWALCIVVVPPIFDDFAGLPDAGELVLVEALLAVPAVEALDVGVLGRLAWVDEAELYPMIIGPSVAHTSAEFRAVVDDQDIRISAPSSRRVWQGR